MIFEHMKGMREKLKEEIKKLESKFPSDHSRLSVTAQRSLDEITVTFKRKRSTFNWSLTPSLIFRR